MAVVAHGLLNSVSAIELGMHALRDSGDRITPAQRGEILNVVSDQAAHIRGVLEDLIRGLPVEFLEALDRVAGD